MTAVTQQALPAQPSPLSRVTVLVRAHPWLAAAVLGGYALRLLLMPTAGYGDLHAIAYALRLLAFEGATDVYSRIHDLPEELAPVPGLSTDFFPYPPLTYLVLGGTMALLRPLYGEAFPAAVSLPYYDFLAVRPQISLWLFLYKLPLLAADLGIALVLWRLGPTAAGRLRLTALWALNPIPIVSVYLFGQFDVLPALFVLLAWYCLVHGRAGWGAAALGISAGFKVYSLLLIPVFAVVAGRTSAERIGLGALALGVFIATLLPLAGDPLAFQVMFGSEALQQAAENGIRIGQVFEHEGVLSLVFLSYAFLLLFAEREAAGKRPRVLPYLLAVLLLTYGFTFGHLQWFTSAAVLLVLDWEQRPANRAIQLLLYACSLLVAASWQVGGFLDFFYPVFPDIDIGRPSIWHLLPDPLAPAMVDAARSGLAGAALFWVYVNVIRARSG